MKKPSTPGDACRREAAHALFSFGYTCSFCFTYQTVFLSTQEFLHFYPCDSLPHPTVEGVRAQLYMVKPQQQDNLDIPPAVLPYYTENRHYFKGCILYGEIMINLPIIFEQAYF